MTSADFDVVIVGSGPAGVSAAFPLLDAGLRVLLVDGGREAQIPPPDGAYLARRSQDRDQWKWMIGADFNALKKVDAISPKLRVPTHSYVFEGFDAANRTQSDGFVSVGSLARGGLSNAWGCGVAKLSAEGLAAFPFAAADLDASYETVTRRMGVSGAGADDMADYFGVDDWAQPPVAMGSLQSGILARYHAHRDALLQRGFRLGRSRVAALSQDQGERRACDLSGSCLWGCHRRSLYSAVEDLAVLTRHPGFTYRPGLVVEHVTGGARRQVSGTHAAGTFSVSADAVILAAGTLASTRLALQAIGFTRKVALRACPAAAFMLWYPRLLGQRRDSEFGLGQLSFALSFERGVTGFGSLFSTTGLPVAEFARYMPLRKRYGIDVLGSLLSSCAVGNLFLPGHLTEASVSVVDGSLHVEGGYSAEVATLMAQAQGRLRKLFWKTGAVLMPGSFTVGRPGSDIHYAGSLPMRAAPGPGETSADGEVFGLDGVYVADGASLSALSEKSHTLTIMANADRIGRRLATKLAGRTGAQ